LLSSLLFFAASSFLFLTEHFQAKDEDEGSVLEVFTNYILILE
jgi:hypothetical protein